MNSEATSEFIDIFRECACLWDTSSALYANRNARRAAQQQLLNVLLKFQDNANLSSVRKKIDSLRAMFFREHKKKQSSESGTGTGTEDVYVPNWVHYNELLFLCDAQRAARAGTDSLGTPPPSVSGETSENDWKNDGEEMEDVQTTEKVDGDFRPPPPKVSNKRMSAQKQLIAAAQKLAEAPTFAVAPPDKWESFGLSVAGDLRLLKDVKQQAIAQKIISDAIFWAKMGRLTEASSVSLAPSASVTSTSSVAFPYHITSLHSPSPNIIHSPSPNSTHSPSPNSIHSHSPINFPSDQSPHHPSYYPSHSHYPSDQLNIGTANASSQELEEFIALRRN